MSKIVMQKNPCLEVWEVRTFYSEHGSMMTGIGHSCQYSKTGHPCYHKCPCGARKKDV